VSENEGIFHLTSASDFFYCLHVALDRYQRSRSKRIEDTFFLVMGANHLREWIAPGYRPEFDKKTGEPSPAPLTEAEKFYIEVFDDPDFKIVRGLCNRAKHLTKECSVTSYSNSSNLMIDDLDCMIDDVLNWDEGPPTGFYVEGEEVGEILHRLLNTYRHAWFEHRRSTDLTT
jgi:hypothetical protein